MGLKAEPLSLGKHASSCHRNSSCLTLNSLSMNAAPQSMVQAWSSRWRAQIIIVPLVGRTPKMNSDKRKCTGGRGWDVAHLTCIQSWVQSLPLQKQSLLTPTCNLKMAIGRLEGPGYPWFIREFKANLGYIKCCLKTHIHIIIIYNYIYVLLHI